MFFNEGKQSVFLGGPNFALCFLKVASTLSQLYGANIAENDWMEDEMSFWCQKAYFQKAFAVSGNDKGCKTLRSNVALVNTPFALAMGACVGSNVISRKFNH